jgi:hypothetical protein
MIVIQISPAGVYEIAVARPPAIRQEQHRQRG